MQIYQSNIKIYSNYAKIPYFHLVFFSSPVYTILQHRQVYSLNAPCVQVLLIVRDQLKQCWSAETRESFMEEQKVQQFVDQSSRDGAFRQRLQNDPQATIQQEGYAGVASVVLQLVPHLAFDGQRSSASFSWWW